MELTTGHLTLATSYSRTAYRRTTIGAAAFHFRVRNGNGWGHCAIVTRPSYLHSSSWVWWPDSRSIKSLPAFAEATAWQASTDGPQGRGYNIDSRFTFNDSRFRSLKERQFPGIYIRAEERDSRFVTSLHRFFRFDSRLNHSPNLKASFCLRSLIPHYCSESVRSSVLEK